MSGPKSLLFIPDNVKFVKKVASYSTPDIEEMSLDEKIKACPDKRQEFILQAKMKGQPIRRNNVPQSVNTQRTVIDKNVENTQGNDNFIDDGIRYLINKTDSDIVLSFTAEPASKEHPRGGKPVVLKDFINADSIDIDHPEIISLLDKKLVEIVDERGISEISKRTQNREIKAQQALNIRERDLDAMVYDMDDKDKAMVVDSSVSSSSESSEMDALIRQQMNEGSNMGNMSGDTDISSMFSDPTQI